MPKDVPKLKAIPRFELPQDSREYKLPPSQPISAETPDGRRLQTVKTKFEQAPNGQLHLPNQQVALVNICHHGHRPRHREAGYRILGVFRDVAAAKTAQDQLTDCSTWCWELHRLMPIMRSTALQSDAKSCERHAEKLAAAQLEHAQARDAEFKANVDKGLTGKTSLSRFARLKPSAAPDEKDPKDGIAACNDALRETVPNQRFAVVAHVPDVGGAPPCPGVAVLGAFENEVDALEYAKGVASHAYPNAALDIVCMYEWLFPQSVDLDQVKTEYGFEQLNDIMSGRKDAMRQTEAYRRYCSKHGIQPSESALPEKDQQNQQDEKDTQSRPSN